MNFYPQDRRSSQDSINSLTSSTAPNKEASSPVAKTATTTASTTAPITKVPESVEQAAEPTRKNPPIVRHVMDSAPADFSAFKHCCQCGTILAISNWCIDCSHYECRKC